MRRLQKKLSSSYVLLFIQQEIIAASAKKTDHGSSSQHKSQALLQSLEASHLINKRDTEELTSNRTIWDNSRQEQENSSDL